jgi:hypothetical protein
MRVSIRPKIDFSAANIWRILSQSSNRKRNIPFCRNLYPPKQETVSETTEKHIVLAFRFVREGVTKFSESLEDVFDEGKNAEKKGENR